MADISVREITDKDEWEQFIAVRPEANFLHSWYWGEFHHRLKHTVLRRGYYEGSTLIGVLLAIVEPARRGRHMVIPGGPIMDWDKMEKNPIWVNDIRLLAKRQACVFVRIRPQRILNSENVAFFRSFGFRKAPMHLHAELTSQLDLSKPDEELRKAMRKGTRYELNQATKLGIDVSSSEKDDWLDEFYDLQIKTAQRQQFVPFSKKFLVQQFQTFAEAHDVLLYKATYNGELLNMAFIIFYGKEAAYHYGASTDAARQYPGAYAIQREAIAEARRRGCARYNFWGVAEHHQTTHRFYGVSVFKRGFGGEDVAYVPAQDLIIQPARYALTYSFETARRKFRKL